MGATEDLDRAIEASHAALDEIAKGNPSRYLDLYSHRDDATLANPFGPPARGRQAIEDAVRRAATYYRDGKITGVEVVAKVASAELAYTLEIERFETKVGGSDELAAVALRVTSIYALEEGAWKLVHRHADPITTAREADSILSP